MPTSRAVTFLSAALVLYLFANQTQVGWLYVMSALLAGTVLAAWWMGRTSLRGIKVLRQIKDIELYEGDLVQINLSLRKLKGTGTSHIRMVEMCPLAAPDSAERSYRMFIPSLPSGGSVHFDYEVTADRRGLYEFPPIILNSRAPFGFFRRQRPIVESTRILVYPEVRPLRRLDLLDRQSIPEVIHQRSGVGYEVIGVRPYRIGDSARHIHWRSVARKGELISKEFADESQPGLTIMLDLFNHRYPDTVSKYTPFEWMVKVAVSIAEYAYRKGYPLHILADDEVLPIPTWPVTWTALLQYLARVQPTGTRPLTDVIGKYATQTYVAVVLPWPNLAIAGALLEGRNRREDILALVLNPETFPGGGDSASGFAAQLKSNGIGMRLVSFADDWTDHLNESDGLKRVTVP